MGAFNSGDDMTSIDQREEAIRLKKIEDDAKWWEAALPKGWLLLAWSYRYHATVRLPNGASWQIGLRERDVIERIAKIEKAATDLVNHDHNGSHWDQVAELRLALEPVEASA
jgi:hypothetical protein